jgi:hypothetical protein
MSLPALALMEAEEAALPYEMAALQTIRSAAAPTIAEIEEVLAPATTTVGNWLGTATQKLSDVVTAVNPSRIRQEVDAAKGIVKDIDEMKDIVTGWWHHNNANQTVTGPSAPAITANESQVEQLKNPDQPLTITSNTNQAQASCPCQYSNQIIPTQAATQSTSNKPQTCSCQSTTQISPTNASQQNNQCSCQQFSNKEDTTNKTLCLSNAMVDEEIYNMCAMREQEEERLLKFQKECAMIKQRKRAYNNMLQNVEELTKKHKMCLEVCGKNFEDNLSRLQKEYESNINKLPSTELQTRDITRRPINNYEFKLI